MPEKPLPRFSVRYKETVPGASDRKQRIEAAFDILFEIVIHYPQTVQGRHSPQSGAELLTQNPEEILFK